MFLPLLLSVPRRLCGDRLWTERRASAFVSCFQAAHWRKGRKDEILDRSITFPLPSCFLILSGFRFKPAYRRSKPHPISCGSNSFFRDGAVLFLPSRHNTLYPAFYVLRFGRRRTGKGDVLQAEPRTDITSCAPSKVARKPFVFNRAVGGDFHICWLAQGHARLSMTVALSSACQNGNTDVAAANLPFIIRHIPAPLQHRA
jgi:hypothetical protein